MGLVAEITATPTGALCRQIELLALAPASLRALSDCRFRLAAAELARRVQREAVA